MCEEPGCAQYSMCSSMFLVSFFVFIVFFFDFSPIVVAFTAAAAAAVSVWCFHFKFLFSAIILLCYILDFFPVNDARAKK